MKNKDFNLKVVKHIVTVNRGIDVSWHDNYDDLSIIKNEKRRHINFEVNVYFKNNAVKAVRIQLPHGWLTNELTDPIRSELLDFIRPLNPLYKNLTTKNILSEAV
jgi:hypothetical protein